MRPLSLANFGTWCLVRLLLLGSDLLTGTLIDRSGRALRAVARCYVHTTGRPRLSQRNLLAVVAVFFMSRPRY